MRPSLLGLMGAPGFSSGTASHNGTFPGSRAYRTQLVWKGIRSFEVAVPAPIKRLPCPRCGKELDGLAHQPEHLVPFYDLVDGEIRAGLQCRVRA